MKSKLYGDKNDAVRLRFLVRTYSCISAFKHYPCSLGYTHLNALIRLLETTLRLSLCIKPCQLFRCGCFIIRTERMTFIVSFAK